MSQTAAHSLRAQSQVLAGKLPPVLAQAHHLAATIQLGTHGRRRAGRGDEFWQYRPAQPGDARRTIDWRRSARADQHYVQDKEWQAAQTVWFWVDAGHSMQFSSTDTGPTKAHAAQVVALALAILLVRAGERVGLIGQTQLPPAGGELQIERMALSMVQPPTAPPEYETPHLRGIPRYGRLVLLSDFLTDLPPLITEIDQANGAGLSGAMVQMLDPQEIDFPFRGRIIFESMQRSFQHETRQAGALRATYAARLAERQQALHDLARRTGWQFRTARSDASLAQELLWVSQAIERRAK